MTDHRPIRLAVLDDGLFVRTHAGEVRPLSATFNRFVEAVARNGAFERVRYIVPVRQLRHAETEPTLEPIDEQHLEIVPTAFFSGIADYLLRASYLCLRNWSPIDRAISDSDLVWLRLPASNALLALAAAHRHAVPHFGWLAGSVRAVARAQRRPAPLGWVAQAVGSGYDAVSQLAGRSGPLIRLDADLFASAVTAAEVEQTRAAMASPRSEGPWRVVWAGRMATEKGLPELIEAVRLVRQGDRDVSLVLIGDGPARPALERALDLPADRIEDHGYVGDRIAYMNLLRGGDILLHPSHAEGVPKVLVEAMAAGLPIVAADAGAVREVLGAGERGRIVPVANAPTLADAAGELLDAPDDRAALRERGLAWAAQHTAEAQAARLIGRLRIEFPQLDWPS